MKLIRMTLSGASARNPPESPKPTVSHATEPLQRRTLGAPMNASAVPILECSGLERRFGGLVAVTGVDLRIDRGEIFGLVGPNGSGKTTLVNAVTGFYPPQKGRIVLQGADITAIRSNR